MFQRKAQNNANGAAVLVIVVTVLIVLYILFLPPNDRAELLGEPTGSSGGSGSQSGSSGSKTLIKLLPSMTLLEENVGRVNYVDSKERSHTMPSFRVSTKTDGSIIQEIESLYVKSSVFDSIIENVTFKVDTELTSGLKLSFNTGKEANGRLMMVLNGKQIFNEVVEPESSKVIVLPADDLQRYNVLTMGVSSPGWAFWAANEYQLNSLQITGNIKDLSGSETKQTFIIDDEELENIDRVILKYFVDCETSKGNLLVQVNGRNVFSGLADCGILNTMELDPRIVDWGENDIIFSTANGNYLISNLEIKTMLKAPVYPIYYFEMDEGYFVGKSAAKVCGAVDGVCPAGCEDDADKDCCFMSTTNFWCDLETEQFGDRCVAYVSEQTCSRCESSYEDKAGKAPKNCEKKCGDDYDKTCLAGCSQYLDKDCCFAFDDEAYWCEDYPVGKPLSAVCNLGVETDERKVCPKFYVNEDGKRLSFTAVSVTDGDKLLNVYEVSMLFAFPNTDLKSATLLINGKEFGLETRNVDWERDISSYVVSGTNSIQIKPARSIDITSMKVAVDRKSNS